MKNIILTFSLLLVASLGFSQIKVINSGDVGIGTTSPAAQLHVDGGDMVVTNGKMGVGTDSPDDDYQLQKQATLAFSVRRVNNSNPAVIDNFVRLVAGNAGSGFFFEEDNYFAITPGVDVDDNGTDWANALVLWGANASGSKAGKVAIGKQNPSEKLDVVGNIKYSGALINSDKRLKKNVNKFDAGLEEVLQLNPITFQYNGEGGTINGDEHIGLYAQELESVVPALVKPYTHEIYEEINDVDHKAQVIKTEEYLSIKDNEIKYMLINAIKDQQAIIEKKEERIASLEEQMAQLLDAVNDIKNGISEGTFVSEVTLESYDLASLEQNTPNPFNGYTEINYVVPTESRSAQIQIYDLSGKLMKTVNVDHKGEGTLKVNASDIPSGTYSYTLLVDGRVVDTKKMALTR